jgi:hypothetical protein
VSPDLEDDMLHQFKNHLALAISYAELMMDEFAAGDAHREDLTQLRDAINQAIAMLPDIERRMK